MRRRLNERGKGIEMNKAETATVLATIATHYWQTTNLAERNIDLMVETWTMVLSDIPLRPDIESVLERWLRTEKWPPQAAELRELALNADGRRPARIANLRRIKQAGTLGAAGRAELAELEAGGALREPALAISGAIAPGCQNGGRIECM